MEWRGLKQSNTYSRWWPGLSKGRVPTLFNFVTCFLHIGPWTSTWDCNGFPWNKGIHCWGFGGGNSCIRKGDGVEKYSSKLMTRWNYFVFLLSIWIIDNVTISYSMQGSWRLRLFGDSVSEKGCSSLCHRQTWVVLDEMNLWGTFLGGELTPPSLGASSQLTYLHVVFVLFCAALSGLSSYDRGSG